MNRIVSFRQMKDGTKADYELLDQYAAEFALTLADRVLASLRNLSHSLEGYPVTRLVHSVQTATRARRDGADDDLIVAALLHDIGDELAPYNHSELAASIIRPYVRPDVTWVVKQHGLFQNYYYVHHAGGDRNERDKYRDHPAYDLCVRFCADWDQASFDPDYPCDSLESFEPAVRKIFSRQPFEWRSYNALQR